LVPKTFCYQEVSSQYASERMDLISSSLDDVERRNSRKIDYTKKPMKGSYPQSVTQTPKNYDNDINRIRTANPFRDITPKEKTSHKNSTIEFGQENSLITYTEPNFMREKGHMHGIFGSITYRPTENKQPETLNEYFTEDSGVNVFKLDAKMSWGRVNYSSSQGTLDSLEDSMFELRGLIGYDFPAKETRFTPYMGLGLRYLKNDLRGTIVQPDLTEAKGYRRSSRYFYLPIGLDTTTMLQNDISLGFNFEYYFLINGKQKSHLEDIDSGFDTLTNGQGTGFGLKSSISFKKDFQNYLLFIEPFYRYWNIADSEISPVYYEEIEVGSGLEPKNNSTEYGFKIGLDF
ncbi:MAG: hypothetical protein KKF78_08275, partial [Candidatus Omnitrophica bacterium]|nr:hypothetical protein [Candidatus Omnitrophota bacterium]MBU1997138.1 hypothetical protein [Candidatus Omnitrophota bacterium]